VTAFKGPAPEGRASLSSKSHLHDFERGHKAPRLDALERIDRALAAGGELVQMAIPVRACDDSGMHCMHEIGPDRDGFWVHVDGGFKCRVANVVLSTFAEPPRPPSWPLNATARDDGDLAR